MVTEYTVEVRTGISTTQILRSTIDSNARYTLESTIVNQHVRTDTDEVVRTEVAGVVRIEHEELMANPAIAATFGALQQGILAKFSASK